MLSDQSNQAETSVEPIEATGVEEVVALIPIPEYVNELVTRAKQAAVRLARLSTATKNRALLAMAAAGCAYFEQPFNTSLTVSDPLASR